MPTPKITKEVVEATVKKAIAAGYPQKTLTEVATALGIPRPTLSRHLKSPLLDKSIAPAVVGELAPHERDELLLKVKTLTTQLKAYKGDELDNSYVRQKIFGLSEAKATPPSWLIDASPSKSNPGVPTLFGSDWHWGEVIQPTEVGGINHYNLETSHARLKRLIERTINLLDTHMVNPKYPGIVFILGGDMVSGDIHDELKETNDIPLIPAVLDLFDHLVGAINTLADKFGRVFLPCVTGNHGRNTLKIRAKNRHYTSFDWLLYQMLDKHFEKDSRVTFLIPDGPDAYYKVYNHRYLLTHGDQFRGGDGMIGALGPIIRGDHKKRSRNNQIDMGYDTLLLGHWHQLIQMQRLIVNGSLCGYNEYAYAGNFPFEEPKQGLWLTHPQYGITFSIPVNVGEPKLSYEAPWVSVK